MNTFRQTPTRLEIIGERDTPDGPLALSGPADPDQGSGMPCLPQHPPMPRPRR